MLDLAVNFFLGRKNSDGAIIDGRSTSSDGAYTVGYPLAVIGRARQDDALQQLALTQLRVRQARLFNGQTFWRTSDAGGGRGNRNWARGLAWQMLGMARTLRELRTRSDTAELIAGFQQLSAYAQPFQRADGLWSVFIDDPNLTPDTGGSAGIGAALAIGAQQGWLGHESRSAATKCLNGLRAHLTLDGFLGGVSQSNKGGEARQRGSYRVIYPMGMGLMAQLIAAIN
jgi:rhamnogalacturonyl hydrolase YesR